MPIFNPSIPPVVATSGTYTGNNTANRAIPHGLARIPNLVILTDRGNGYMWRIQGIQPTIIYYHSAAAMGESGAVTAMDATNFYVGDGTVGSYLAANRSPNGYSWSAYV